MVDSDDGWMAVASVLPLFCLLVVSLSLVFGVLRVLIGREYHFWTV